MRRLVFFLCLCWSIALTSLARAQAAPPTLGARGTWLVGGGAGLSSDRRQWIGDPALLDSTNTSIWFTPWVAFFIAPQLALGISANLEHTDYHRDDGSSIADYSYGGSALVFYHVALAGQLSLLPRLSVGAAYETLRYQEPQGVFGTGGTGLNYRIFSLLDEFGFGGERAILDVSLNIPLVVSPTPAFYVGVGPYLHWRYALTGDLGPAAVHWLLSLGVSTVIGSWF